MQKNIYLLGFMGCGKTTIGKKLATALSYTWQDLDHIIVSRNGMSISDIFRTYGEAFFRKEEANVLRNTAMEPPKVISCGGGLPCHRQNMSWIRDHGLSVFLDVAPPVLHQRLLRGQAARPLLQGMSPETLLQFIIAKLAERRPYYEQADIIIHQTEEDQDMANLILERIQQKGGV